MTNNNTLPVIEHATVTLNEWGRVVAQMDDSWLFYRLDIFPEKTPPEEIAYSRYGVFPLNYDFSNFVVLAESDIPEKPEEPTIPAQPEPETEATEEDYINALEDLGVNFDE